MKQILFWTLCLGLFGGCNYSPTVDLTGNWEWVFTNEHGQTHQVRMQLQQTEDQKTIGFYCSAYAMGEYVDCASSDDEQKDVPNFVLEPVTSRVFQGKFRSNRGNNRDEIGEIKIIYHISTNSIFVDLLKEPASSFYFPDEVNFNKTD